VTCVFFARDPEKVLKAGGNNLMVAYNHLLANVSKIVAPIETYGDLKTKPRSGEESIFKNMLNTETTWSIFNEELFQATGFLLLSIAGGEISTNRELEKATELLQLKQLEADARVVEAEGSRQADIKLAEGAAAYTKNELEAIKGAELEKLGDILMAIAQKIFNKKS
jgi:hypothetical protein